MEQESFEEITVQIDGKFIHWPKGDYSRLAGSAVCNIAAKITNLRKLIKDYDAELSPELKRKLNQIAEPYSFERYFTSSSLVELHHGIKLAGEEALKE